MENTKELKQPTEENLEALKWFEKYQIIKNALKVTEFNNGVLKSENDELKHELSGQVNRNKELINKIANIEIQLDKNPNTYGHKRLKELKNIVTELQETLLKKNQLIKILIENQNNNT